MNSNFLGSVAAFWRANKFAVICSVLGVVLAVLFITLGFLKTLLIAALAGAGCALGIYLDRFQKKGGQDGSFFGGDE